MSECQDYYTVMLFTGYLQSLFNNPSHQTDPVDRHVTIISILPYFSVNYRVYFGVSCAYVSIYVYVTYVSFKI